MLLSSPGFSLIAIATMMPGVGATTALDSVIDASPLLTLSQKAQLEAVAPEPSTMAVLAMAGAGLMTRRRRK